MSNMDEINEIMSDLAGGGIGLDVDAVMRESAKNTLIQNGNENPSKEDIDGLVSFWTEDRKDVKGYYKCKIGELSGKCSGVTQSLAGIPTIATGIATTAASLTAAPAAIPMITSLKNEVNNSKNQLMDCLKICAELNISPPSALTAAVNALKSAIVIVGAL